MTWSHFITKLYLTYVVAGLVFHSSVLNVNCQLCFGPMCPLGGTIGNFIPGKSGLLIEVPIFIVNGQMLTTVSPSSAANAITYVPSRNTEPRSNAGPTQGAHVRTSHNPFKATTPKLQLQTFKSHVHNTTVNIGTIKSNTVPRSNADATQGAHIKTSHNPFKATTPKRQPQNFKIHAHNTKTTVNSGTIKSASLPTSKDTYTTASYRNHSQVEPTNNQETASSKLTDKQVNEFLESHNCFEMSFKLNKETIMFMKPLGEKLLRHQNIQEHLEIRLTCISIIAEVFSLLLLTIFRIRKSMKIFVHKNLLLSLALGDLVYTLDKKLFKSREEHSVTCTSVTVITYYLHTTLYTWMLVEGINLYLKMVKVFTADRKYLTYLMLGWGIPGVIAGVVAAIKPSTYDMSLTLHETITCGSLQFTGKVGRTRCWINGNLWTFKGPVLAILLANLVVFFIVLRVTFRRTRTNYLNATRKGLKTIVALLPLLGVTFLLGFFADFHVAVAYAYITLNSIQGVLFFICHCVFDDQVRDAVRKLLRKKNCIQNPQQREQQNKANVRNLNIDTSGKRKPSRVVPAIN